MNSTELHEAYLEIYENKDAHPDIADQPEFAERVNRELEARRQRRIKQERVRIERAIKGPKPALFNTNVPPSFKLKESQDHYDLILDYLLDEGFASDLQSAQMIMSHMSIDWIYDIISEAQIIMAKR
jgi:hypothetical protein